MWRNQLKSKVLLKLFRYDKILAPGIVERNRLFLKVFLSPAFLNQPKIICPIFWNMFWFVDLIWGFVNTTSTPEQWHLINQEPSRTPPRPRVLIPKNVLWRSEYVTPKLLTTHQVSVFDDWFRSGWISSHQFHFVVHQSATLLVLGKT